MQQDCNFGKYFFLVSLLLFVAVTNLDAFDKIKISGYKRLLQIVHEDMEITGKLKKIMLHGRATSVSVILENRKQKKIYTTVMTRLASKSE